MRWPYVLVGCLVLFGFARFGSAQPFSVSGYVQDAQTGERLPGASIYAVPARAGTTTNAHGFYSLTLPAGAVTLRGSYLGYAADTLHLALLRDVRHTFHLTVLPVALDEVQVVAGPAEPAGVDQVRLTPREIQRRPALLGEADALKTLQLLPGVQSGHEGSAGLHVRGGSPDQNLILLDGVPVYNVGHLFGFVSVFNTDAIQSVNLIKGGFPARYGGRLSSVVDITMKEGNLKEYAVTGSLGLLASRLMVEGPIVKDRSSFVLSGRRTYLDVLAGPFVNGETRRNDFFFSDLNARANYIFSDRSRLYLSLYGGTDRFGAVSSETYAGRGEIETSDADLRWGNLTATLRWTRLLGRRLFLSTTVFYSRYRLETAIEAQTETTDRTPVESFSLAYRSGVRDWSGRVEVDYLPHARHAVRAGLGGTLHTFEPGASRHRTRLSDAPAQDTTLSPDGPNEAVELFGYVEDEVRVSAAFSVHLGVHGSGFFVGEAAYGSVQPRLAARYRLPGGWQLQASFSTMRQYIHLLTNAGIGLPTDLWVPATERINPQDAWQAGLGTERRFRRFTLRVAGFYKPMRHLIAYKEGADFLATGQEWQNKVEAGRGRAYGVEVFLDKRVGRTTGWLAYTWSRSTRRFDAINRGRVFPYRYDRPHDAALVLTHHLTARRSLSLTWVYGTGQAVTLPVGRFRDGTPLDGQTGLIYESRNGVRMRAYHRLDIAYRIRYETRWGAGELSLGLYNVYNRRNPFYMYLGEKERLDPDTGLLRTVDAFKQVSLFPILPSVSYHFTF